MEFGAVHLLSLNCSLPLSGKKLEKSLELIVAMPIVLFGLRSFIPPEEINGQMLNMAAA